MHSKKLCSDYTKIKFSVVDESSKQLNRSIMLSSPKTNSKLNSDSKDVPCSVGMRSVQTFSLFKFFWLCLVAVVVECGAEDSAVQLNAETADADKYLSTFGYYPRRQAETKTLADDWLRPEADEMGGRHTDTERHRAIERLQEFFNVPVSGQLDTKTKAIMRTARCGRKDIDVSKQEDEKTGTEGLQKGNRRVKRYSLNKYGDGTYAAWRNISQLTWKITRQSRQISESQQREIMRKSLAMWAKYMPIRFVEERSQETPDINIHFVRGEHGPQPDPIFDGSPVGTLNVLAHAWGPSYNPKGFAGDVHFDEDDNWKNYSTLLGVAVHELGHAMGLGHTDDINAIMYPVYRDVAELGQDDINGITEMYRSEMGGRPVNPDINRPNTRTPVIWRPDIRTRATVRPNWVIPTTTQQPVNLCLDLNVDAIFEDPTVRIDREYIALSNENVHTLTRHGALPKPRLLQDVFPGAPMNPDVAFSIYKKQTVYFIKDNYIWAYKGSQLEKDYPRSLRSSQFPERPQFTVTLEQQDGTSRLLLFGTHYWWTFDVDRVSTSIYHPISAFSGELPRGIKFAAQWMDKNLYAVTEDSYVIMDLSKRRITHKTPIAGKPDWLQGLCGNADRISLNAISLFAMVILTNIFKFVLV